MRPEGHVSRKKGGGGVSFGCLRLNCAASLQLGGAHFKRISVSQLGGSSGILHWKIFKFNPSEMAGRKCI